MYQIIGSLKIYINPNVVKVPLNSTLLTMFKVIYEYFKILFYITIISFTTHYTRLPVGQVSNAFIFCIT